MNIKKLEKNQQVKDLIEALELSQRILNVLQIYLVAQNLYKTEKEVQRIKNIGIKALAPFKKSAADK